MKCTWRLCSLTTRGSQEMAMRQGACSWIFTVASALFFPQTTGSYTVLYTVGILKLGHVSLHPTWSVKRCDSDILCGRSPTKLHIVTMETSLNRTFKVIEEELDLWILTTSVKDLDLQSTKEFFEARKLPFLDYSQQTLPETDADWCSLLLKYAYRGSRKQEAEAPHLVVNYVLDVVEHTDLRSLVIVYNAATDMEVAGLSDSLSSKGVVHVLHNTDQRDEGHTDHVVDRYWALQSRVVDFRQYTDILFWCNTSCIGGFLSEITQDVNNGTVNIGIQHMTRLLIVHASIWASVPCILTNQAQQVAGDQSVDNDTAHRTPCQAEGPGEILTVVRQFYHVAVLWRTEDCVRLQTMMMTANGSRTLSNAGFSRNQNHMIMTSEAFPNTKWRLNGQKFIVATAIWEPFVMVKKTEGQDEYSGFCIDMLKALAVSLNFTYELRQPADGQYGSIENGSWTGLVRMLKDKKAHLVVAPIAVNELRATVVDFSMPFYQDYTGVLFRRPDPALHKWKTYFLPFSWQVLVMIGVSFVVGTAFGHMIGVWCVPYVTLKEKPNISVMDTVQYFFGSLLAQGGVWRPTTGSARMFVSAWWLFSVVLAAIYSGNLTASFAVSSYDPSFTTLEGMLDQDDYEFGTVPGTIWFDIFKVSNRSDFKRIEKKILRFSQEHAHEKINETNDHVQRTRNEKYAYVSNMGSLWLTLAEHCELMTLEETFLPLQYAIALQKNSPLTNAVSTWILKMNEAGLDDLWASYWWRTSDQSCAVSKKTEAKTIRLEDCQSAFYILLVGLVSALVAGLAENVFHWFLRWKCQDKERQSSYETSQETSQEDTEIPCQTCQGLCRGYCDQRVAESALNDQGVKNGVHRNRESHMNVYKDAQNSDRFLRRSCRNGVHRTVTAQHLCSEETETGSSYEN